MPVQLRKNKQDLTHYGIPGMRWGIRNDTSGSGGGSRSVTSRIKSFISRAKSAGSSSPDSSQAEALRKKALRKLSNDELRTLVTRLQLEKQYKDLTAPTPKKGRYISGLIQRFGAMAFNNYVKSQAGPDYAGYEAFVEALRGKKKKD